MLELAQRVQKVSEHYFRPELSLKLHRRAKEMPLIGCLSAFTLATLFSSPYIHGLLQLWSLLSAIVCVVGHYLLFRKQSKPDYQTYIRWNYIFLSLIHI